MATSFEICYALHLLLLMWKSLGVQNLIKFENYQEANMKDFLPQDSTKWKTNARLEKEYQAVESEC